MGSVRSRDFDAVICVGGVGPVPRSLGIGDKVNWIGVGAHGKTPDPDGWRRGPIVTFNRFVPIEECGQDFRVIAPILAQRMYSRNAPRYLFNDAFNEAEQAEIDRLLEMVILGAPPPRTPPRKSRARPGRCDSKRS